MENGTDSRMISGLRRDMPRIKRAAALCNKAQTEAEKAGSPSEGNRDEPGAVQNVYRLVQEAALELYRIGYFRPAQLTEEQDPGFRLDCSEANENLPVNSRVFVRVNSRGIFVRTPLLWTKNGREGSDRGNPFTGAPNVLFFKKEVSEAVEEQMKKGKFQPGLFRKKIVSFLYVYPVSLEDGPPDNDNHVIKYLLDAVAKHTPGGDGALCCTLVSSAVQSDETPPGTCISLTAEEDGIPAPKGLLAFWKRELRYQP